MFIKNIMVTEIKKNVYYTRTKKSKFLEGLNKVEDEIHFVTECPLSYCFLQKLHSHAKIFTYWIIPQNLHGFSFKKI